MGETTQTQYVCNGNSSQLLYGVTATNQLVSFFANAPGTMITTLPITGLQGGESILGIDFRPANGLLHALGSTSRLYTVNTSTGAATQIGSAGAFTLSGTAFGFDVNPVPDRVRVVSDAEQNMRLNPNDATLSGADVDINPTPADLVGSAYTNSFVGATITTLYGIDAANDLLVIQNPPNAGTLTTVGALGVDVGTTLGFDITRGNEAYAAMVAGGGGSSGLYTINLTTGAATLVGTINAGGLVVGLAAAP
jgi:hypothetical protein